VEAQNRCTAAERAAFCRARGAVLDCARARGLFHQHQHDQPLLRSVGLSATPRTGRLLLQSLSPAR